MKSTILQILGFILMVLGIQGVIVLLVNGDAGIMSGLHLETSLLMGIYIVIGLGGGYLLTWAHKRFK